MVPSKGHSIAPAAIASVLLLGLVALCGAKPVAAQAFEAASPAQILDHRKAANDTTSPVVLTEGATDPSAGGLPAFKIETESATYFLEKSGGGLSSLVDPDGNDWISFHPQEGTGPGGESRGFPNAVHKQAGSYFHPKNIDTDFVTMKVEEVSPERISIVAEAKQGDWAARYEFFSTHATFSITRMPESYHYWILYEGTPGGQFNNDDWWMTSQTKIARPMAVRHEGDIAAPEWIAFGDPRVKRSLVLYHHGDDEHPDAFYQMHNKMTVFGFGRSGLQKYLSNPGERFSIALSTATDHESIGQFVKQTLASKGHQKEAGEL